MKKIFISLCVVILLFNIVSPVLAATKDAYDHKELLEYEGYGQAMYETIVEETTFITGQYTNNKEYVSKSIDQIVDYAKFWKNEAKDFIAEDSLRDAIERGGGYLLTVGDWVKKMFNGYGDKYHPPEPSVTEIYDFTDYIRSVKNVSFENEFLSTQAIVTLELDVIKPFQFNVRGTSTSVTFDPESSNNNFVLQLSGWSIDAEVSGWYYPSVRMKSIGKATHGNTVVSLYKRPTLYKSPTSMKYVDISPSEVGYQHLKDVMYPQYVSKSSNVNDVMNFIISQVNSEDNGLVFSVPLYTPETKPSPYDGFRKHVNEKLSKVTTPQPRAYLSCPNGTKIEMSISGSTFLGVDGKVMVVNKDGTAQVDSAICKLGWEKPPIKYIDDRAAIQTPDGKWQDVETGETVQGSGEDEEEGECGVICSLGKLTKFLLNFFEDLLEFLIKIFIPKNTDFISEGFNDIKDLFDEKLSILSSLKGTMTSLFDDSKSPALEYEVSLPAAGGKTMKLMDINLMATGVPILKKVISGVIVLFTVLYVYRKIVGGGGVMEK